MSHIFISYSTKDGSTEAHQLADALEATGLRCWIAPRDVNPGLPYGGQITRAVRGGRGLVVLLTPGANDSPSVLQEVDAAHSERKRIVPLIVRGTQPSDDLLFYLRALHQIGWTDAKGIAAAIGDVLAPTSEPVRQSDAERQRQEAAAARQVEEEKLAEARKAAQEQQAEAAREAERLQQVEAEERRQREQRAERDRQAARERQAVAARQAEQERQAAAGREAEMHQRAARQAEWERQAAADQQRQQEQQKEARRQIELERQAEAASQAELQRQAEEKLKQEQHAQSKRQAERTSEAMFGEVALELFGVTHDAFTRWSKEPGSVEHRSALLRCFYTLRRGAEIAEFQYMADQIQVLETLVPGAAGEVLSNIEVGIARVQSALSGRLSFLAGTFSAKEQHALAAAAAFMRAELRRKPIAAAARWAAAIMAPLAIGFAYWYLTQHSGQPVAATAPHATSSSSTPNNVPAGAATTSSTSLPLQPAAASSGRASAVSQQAPTVSRFAGETFRDCDDVCPEMVRITPGSFQMGSHNTEKDHIYNEASVHEVHIAYTFAVSKYPTIRAEWKLFVHGTGHNDNSDCLKGQEDNHPVVCVSWQDARDYADWLTRKTGHQYRLLTEAEWEYAARAKAKTGTTPAGSSAQNFWGLYDITGNVYSWTEDCYHDSYAGAPTDGSAWEDRGGACSAFRVVRGGSWEDSPRALHTAFRSKRGAGDLDNGVGFRVARND
jgi:formylglycine-generating enzyme required for sulfatase activity